MIEIYRPSLRAAGAIVVLLAWLASLGWLAARRMSRTEDTTLSSEAALHLAPGTAWFALYAGTTQVGNAAITLDTLSAGYRVSEAVLLEAATGQGISRTMRRTAAWLGATLNVQRIQSDYSRDGRQAGWNVAVGGDTITAHFTSGTSRTQGQTVVSEAPTASIAIPYRLALGGGLAPGRSRRVRLIDGWPLSVGMAQLSVTRDSVIRFADSARTEGPDHHWTAVHSDSVRAAAVVVDGPGGPRRVWIDHRGAISGVVTPLGLRWARTDFDLSESEFRRTLAEQTDAIRAAEPIVVPFAGTTHARDIDTLERRFLVQHRDGSPVDTVLLQLLAGGRQTVHGDTITVHSGPTGLAAGSVRDTTPDPMIQEDAGAIVKVQRVLVTEPLSRERLPALMTAFRSLAALDTAADAPEDALGTLGAHRGRPDGITRLFVALLRASGIPSRYVVGVYPRSDTMLTHSWAEIWSEKAGGWYAVDPASGVTAANTGLIRLASGGSSYPDEMLALIANARLTEISQKGPR